MVSPSYPLGFRIQRPECLPMRASTKVAKGSGMPKFQARQRKPENSGRKKGVPNRRTCQLIETMEELGQTLPERISELLPKLQPEKQMEVYLELMQYVS